MAVWFGATNAEISADAGMDCCVVWYWALTALLVIGTPVIFASERLTRSKVAMPKSGCGVLSAGGGPPVTGGSPQACTCEPSWSNERKNRSALGPRVTGTTVPRLES